MDYRYLYLLLDLSAISIPLACSFYPKAHFASSIKLIIPAIIIPLIFFIAWDVLFTDLGVWGFNKRYLLGINILNLPLEEWLFFICIPYACLFTYFALKHLKPIHELDHWWFIGLGVCFLCFGLYHGSNLYTGSTFILCGVLILFLALKKQMFLSQFFLSFTVILIPFFIINGVLTGSWIQNEVVWYNDSENLGIRLGTIPVEDVFYGMTLLLANVTIWERWPSSSTD